MHMNGLKAWGLSELTGRNLAPEREEIQHKKKVTDANLKRFGVPITNSLGLTRMVELGLFFPSDNQKGCQATRQGDLWLWNLVSWLMQDLFHCALRTKD